MSKLSDRLNYISFIVVDNYPAIKIKFPMSMKQTAKWNILEVGPV